MLSIHTVTFLQPFMQCLETWCNPWRMLVVSYINLDLKLITHAITFQSKRFTFLSSWLITSFFNLWTIHVPPLLQVAAKISRGKDLSQSSIELTVIAEPLSYIAFSALEYMLYDLGSRNGLTEVEVSFWVLQIVEENCVFNELPFVCIRLFSVIAEQPLSMFSNCEHFIKL